MGEFRKWHFFTDYCICAHIVDGWVWKSPKICWRSVGMFQDRPFVSPMSSLKRSHRKRAVPIKKNFTAARDFVHLTAFYWKKKHGFWESPAHISISKFQLVVQSPSPQALSQILAPPTFQLQIQWWNFNCADFISQMFLTYDLNYLGISIDSNWIVGFLNSE